jgi:hypothetical protein
MIKTDLKRFKQIMETGTGELNKSDPQTSDGSQPRGLDVSTNDIRKTIADTSAAKNS